MDLKKLTYDQLMFLRESLIIEGFNPNILSDLILQKEEEYINYLKEDGPGGAAAAASTGVGGGGVAYANASIGGMGSVVSPQPSQFAGVTSEPGYTLGGGRTGSGDISVPYNPGGRKKVFQKQSAYDNRKGTNKRRKNKLLSGLKNVFSQKQDYTAKQGSTKSSKIMDFDKFSKEDLMRVTKVKN
jgi:hypothetical protein